MRLDHRPAKPELRGSIVGLAGLLDSSIRGPAPPGPPVPLWHNISAEREDVAPEWYSGLGALIAALRPRHLCGGVTSFAAAYTTGWRMVEGSVVAQVTNGQMRLHLADQPETLIHDGDAVCVAAGSLHRFEVLTPDTVSTWCHLELSVLETVDLTMVMVPRTVRTGHPATEIGRLNGELAKASDPCDPDSAVRRQARLWDLVELVLSGSTIAHQHHLADLDRLRPALDLIESHLDRGLTVAVIAKAVGLSVSQFHAHFRHAPGVSPIAWMRRRRLARAQHLLLTTREPVHAIATRCGYGDPYHFQPLVPSDLWQEPL